MHIGMRLLAASFESLADLRGANRTTTVWNCYPAMGDMNNHILPMILYLVVHIFLNLFRLYVSTIHGLEV